MKNVLSLLFLCLLACGQQILLVEDGNPAAEIILPAEPLSVESFAAQELRDHIRLISGANCPILSQPTGEKLPIRLGRAAKLDLAGFQKNSAKIRIAEDGIDIAGVDGTGDALNMFTAGGTMFGVYDFLEKQLGVRWLWQGELGTTYPQNKDIRVPVTDWETHPLVFSCWRISGGKAERWTDKANFRRFQQEEILWMRRHRFAMADTLNRGHAWVEWYDRYHAEHPDWFNLLPNGQREPDPFYFGARKDLISMCVSNPGFIQEVFEAWKKRDTNDIINANENDTAGKCTCPNCLAEDGIGNDAERAAEAKRRFEAKDPQWWKALGSLSDRYCRLYLKLLEMGKKVNPACRVMGGTYANHNDPPLFTKLNKDVILRMTPPIMYMPFPAFMSGRLKGTKITMATLRTAGRFLHTIWRLTSARI